MECRGHMLLCSDGSRISRGRWAPILGAGRQPVVWQNFAENCPLGSVTAVDQCFWLVRVSLVIEFRNAKELKRLLICPKIGSQLLFVPQQ